MGFLKLLFNKKDIGGGLQLLLPKKFTSNKIDPSKLAEAYRKWVYICVSKNADAIASQNMRLVATTNRNDSQVRALHKQVSKETFAHDTSLIKRPEFKQAENIVEIINHPFLQLLEKPNQNDSQYTFIYSLVTNLELFGTAYLYIQKDPLLNIPVNMEVLHSQFVTIEKNNGKIKEYRYGFGKSQVKYKPEDIVRIKYYSPYSDMYGFAPLQAVYTQYQLDDSFDAYQLAINENSGNPSGIIKYNGGVLNEKDRAILEKSWNKTMKGISNTGKVKVIGGDFDLISIGMNPKDMDFKQGRIITRESILSAFGVPVSFVAPQEINRASFETTLMQYQMQTVEPKIRQIIDDINAHIISMYEEPRLYLTYDDPVEQRRKDKVNDIIRLVEVGILTAEDARSELLN